MLGNDKGWHSKEIAEIDTSRRLWILPKEAGKLSTIALLAFSLVSSSLLLILCSRRLFQKEFRANAALIQVLLISVLDVSQSLWSFIPVFAGYEPGDGSQYCPLFMKVRNWLLLASMLMSAAMTLGVLLALLGKCRLRWWQRISPCLVLILTFSLQPNFFNLSGFKYDTTGCDFPHNVGCCWAGPDNSYLYVGVQLASILSFMFCVQVYMLVRIWRMVPGSVVSRCILSASGYVGACFVSYLGYAATLILTAYFDDKPWPTWLDWMSFIAWRLMMINGFFNLLAMMYHGRMLLLQAGTALELEQQRTVRIDPTPDIVPIRGIHKQEVVAYISEQISSQRDILSGLSDLLKPSGQPGWPHDLPSQQRCTFLGRSPAHMEALRDIGFLDGSLLATCRSDRQPAKESKLFLSSGPDMESTNRIEVD